MRAYSIYAVARKNIRSVIRPLRRSSTDVHGGLWFSSHCMGLPYHVACLGEAPAMNPALTKNYTQIQFNVMILEPVTCVFFEITELAAIASAEMALLL